MTLVSRAVQALRLATRRIGRRAAGCLLGLALAGLPAAGARALTPQQAHDMAAGDGDARIAAIDAAMLHPDARLAVFVQALLDDAVKTDDSHAYIVRDDHTEEAATGQTAEGVTSCASVLELARKHGVEMPITEVVAAVIAGSLSVRDAVVALMSRSAKPEWYGA